MKIFFKFLAVFSLMIAVDSQQAQAQMRPKILEIDGERLSSRESMDLILGRNEKNREPLMAIFTSIKLNGIELTPIKLKHGQASLFITEEGSGDSSTYEEKLRSNKRTGLTCKSTDSIPTPAGIEIKRAINLQPGQGTFLMTYDPRSQDKASSVNFYICPAI
jgi:hypothetical protein